MESARQDQRKLIAILLFAIVTMQLLYFGLRSAGSEFDSKPLWTTEALVYLLLSVLGFAQAIQGSERAAYVAIALGGLLNVLQTGMGLTMFGPLGDAGEALGPAQQAVVAGAFYYYFAGKVLFGLAAVLLGLAVVRVPGVSSLSRIAGGLACLAGLVALVANGLALGVGMTLTFAAGASGTIATLLMALLIALSAGGGGARRS